MTVGIVLADSTPLSMEQIAAEQQAWRETFSRRYHARTKNWVHKGFDWHIFSYEFVPAVTGDRAIDEVKRLLGEPVNVVSDGSAEKPTGATGVLADVRAPFHGRDVLLTSLDRAWTLACTHEDYCGPYFCLAEWAAPESPR